MQPFDEILAHLRNIDWDFEDSHTTFYTHSYHPYPAKFIPQIPRNLILSLSKPGDKILDPFCGSGTTLVEAILHDRDVIGIDINPLSALIAKVKATPLQPDQLKPVNNLLFEINEAAASLHSKQTLFSGEIPNFEYAIPDYEKLRFWFKDFAIAEAALIKHHIYQIDDEDLRDFLKVALSSILVTISKQDSDTRYVRREKNSKPGDAVKLFSRKTQEMIQDMEAFSENASKRRPQVFTADAQNVGELLESNSVALVITSPPYPNAYSYHLYHRNRMFWLDMDPYPVKEKEIGSHRKYSAKNGADAGTFKREMSRCFDGLADVLQPGGVCCFVIGDSIVRGELIRNNELLKQAATDMGFELIDDIRRTIQSTRKAFNPKIGKIKKESILLLKNTRK